MFFVFILMCVMFTCNICGQGTIDTDGTLSDISISYAI